MKDCLFVFSIDTEEEWDWNGVYPVGDISVKNVSEIPDFQKMLTDQGVKTTYFLDYAVVDDEESLACLKKLKEEYSDIEFGAHLHPWVTPPIVEVDNEKNSHIVNLPISVTKLQLKTLTSKIHSEFGISPVAFRSGRWGINNEILSLLTTMGYTVDSSVYPYYENDWFSYLETESVPSYLTPDIKDPSKVIFELPISAGFNLKDYKKSKVLFNQLQKKPWKHFKTIGLLWHLRLLKKIYMCPELSTLTDMKRLCDTLLENDYPVIHMYMHSSSLLPGSTKYVLSKTDKSRLINDIKEVINYLTGKCNLQMCTITEASNILLSQRSKD